VVNDGPEKILYLSLTVEFADSMNQIALRETRGVLGVPTAALAPGERRPFEISFDTCRRHGTCSNLTCALLTYYSHSKIDIR